MSKLTENFWKTKYREQIGKMTGVCYRYVANRQVPEDLAHDAFIIAIDKAAGFKGKDSFETDPERVER